ncbi:hypothetical protein MSKU3_1238 [Komagataeibacter oboediens]|nr:hypothetical protein MSKU3_1238 [Komagataeibacter oboediens]
MYEHHLSGSVRDTESVTGGQPTGRMETGHA